MDVKGLQHAAFNLKNFSRVYVFLGRTEANFFFKFFLRSFRK